MTSRLSQLDDYREPPDCPYAWGDGYDPCAWHDLPVHRCLIQGGHEGPCLCMCTAEPPPVLPRPPRFRWTGKLDDSELRIARRLRRAARDAHHTVPQEPSTVRRNGNSGEES